MSLKLNIGSGETKIPGYLSVDKFAKNIDVRADAKKLPYKNNFVDEIYSCHMIEHQHNVDVIPMFKEWYRVLKPSGILIIKCPNFETYLREFLAMKDTDPLKYTWGIINIYGHTHRSEGLGTRGGFTVGRLKTQLSKIGFKTIECKATETRVKDKKHVEYRVLGDLYYKGVK